MNGKTDLSKEEIAKLTKDMDAVLSQCRQMFETVVRDNKDQDGDDAKNEVKDASGTGASGVPSASGSHAPAPASESGGERDVNGQPADRLEAQPQEDHVDRYFVADTGSQTVLTSKYADVGYIRESHPTHSVTDADSQTAPTNGQEEKHSSRQSNPHDKDSQENNTPEAVNHTTPNREPEPNGNGNTGGHTISGKIRPHNESYEGEGDNAPSIPGDVSAGRHRTSAEPEIPHGEVEDTSKELHQTPAGKKLIQVDHRVSGKGSEQSESRNEREDESARSRDAESDVMERRVRLMLEESGKDPTYGGKFESNIIAGAEFGTVRHRVVKPEGDPLLAQVRKAFDTARDTNQLPLLNAMIPAAFGIKEPSLCPVYILGDPTMEQSQVYSLICSLRQEAQKQSMLDSMHFLCTMFSEEDGRDRSLDFLYPDMLRAPRETDNDERRRHLLRLHRMIHYLTTQGASSNKTRTVSHYLHCYLQYPLDEKPLPTPGGGDCSMISVMTHEMRRHAICNNIWQHSIAAVKACVIRQTLHEESPLVNPSPYGEGQDRFEKGRLHRITTMLANGMSAEQVRRATVESRE